MLMLIVSGALRMTTIGGFTQAYIIVLVFSIPGYLLYRIAVWWTGRESYALAVSFGGVAGILPMLLMTYGVIQHRDLIDSLRVFGGIGAIGAISGASVVKAERMAARLLGTTGRASAAPGRPVGDTGDGGVMAQRISADYGPAVYLRMVAVTAAVTAAIMAFFIAGPVGLLFGLPFALMGLAIGVPIAALIGAPVWFACWRLGLRLGWRPDMIAVLSALLVGLVWVAATKYLDMQLPYNQPRGENDPIVLPGLVENLLAAMASSSYASLLVAPFVAMRFYGEARD